MVTKDEANQNVEFMAETISSEVTKQNFEQFWSEEKENIRSHSKKEIAEYSYHTGAGEALRFFGTMISSPEIRKKFEEFEKRIKEKTNENS